MKKIIITVKLLLIMALCAGAVEWYASVGYSGSHDTIFKSGALFRGEAFAPLPEDMISYTCMTFSSADLRNYNKGNEFNTTEILFKKVRENLYLGAGEGYMLTNTGDDTDNQFMTLGSVLWYARKDVRAMFTYSRENENEVSGAKLETTYLYKQTWTLSAWFGYYKYAAQQISGWHYGVMAGLYIW